MFNSVSLANSEVEALELLLDANLGLLREMEKCMEDLAAAAQADQAVKAELRNATQYALETSASIKVSDL